MKRIVIVACVPFIVYIQTSFAQNTFPWPINGNIGIGTVNPTELLEVNGNSKITGTILTQNIILSGTNSQVINSGTGLYSGFFSPSFNSASDNVIKFRDYNSNEYGRFISNGNLGINTVSPTEKLEVNGNMKVGGMIFTANIRLSGTNSQLINDGTGLYSGFFSPSFNSASDNVIKFRDYSSNEYARFDSNGNFAVGTSIPDPQSKLTVAGNIHSREIKITSTAGADFVFDDDYKLRSLVDTEAFIKANKHLPEIAPAETMRKDGIELGKMNIKLLQKIEELTLHLINLNKIVETQNVKIADQEERLNKLSYQ